MRVRGLEAGRPSRTAFGAAGHRAVHQDLDGAVVFRDPLAWSILGTDRAETVATAKRRNRPALRYFIAMRHRFAEDALAGAVARGTDQAVVLGAGLDTFAYRNPHPALRVFEIDHPATAAWKQQRLADAGIEIPDSVAYVGVDFERDDLLERLAANGVDLGRPVFFMWLGVVPYLTPDAVRTTLSAIATIPGGEVVFDYPTPTAELSGDAARLRHRLSKRVAKAGEPFRSEWSPEEAERLLADAGFGEVENLGPGELIGRYFGVDPTTVPAGGGHLIRGLRTLF